MSGDDSEHLDEFGDVPPIELLIDPIAEIPEAELTLLGEFMAWTAYIEVDMFLLYLLANPGSEVQRRKEFYRDTSGLSRRIALVRTSFEGKLEGVQKEALRILLERATILSRARNEWAHNPMIRFGPERLLVRWIVGSGDFAGRLVKVDGAAIRPHLRDLQQLHQGFTNLASLIRSPGGESYAIAFGEKTERLEAQIARLISPPDKTDD
ncbi:hypothetical protein [Methylobacterium sp. J-092]|uniref:hypothetical protein n=1 Tax=Methylobacterium sp. J-092 TaxID=2836667 RepID=UPI001FBA5853|nr:hypothetical protein [Methylobacterium sp. J-092]MCJ2010445.1 hypothetical protein [Methylobacterium sp. J-092]